MKLTPEGMVIDNWTCGPMISFHDSRLDELKAYADAQTLARIKAERERDEAVRELGYMKQWFPPCKVCGGQGEVWDGPADDPQRAQCQACYATGYDQNIGHQLDQTERERDALAFALRLYRDTPDYANDNHVARAALAALAEP